MPTDAPPGSLQINGIRVETIREQQVTHAEAMAMKRRAHILVDECVTGSYHRNSLEGLAAGCVVGIRVASRRKESFNAHT